MAEMDMMILPASDPTCDLRSRLSLSPSNGAIPCLPFDVRRLLVILATPHLAFQPGTVHNLPKPTHCLLNRLALTQRDLNCHNGFSCSDSTMPPMATIAHYTRNDEGAIHLPRVKPYNTLIITEFAVFRR
jgi:hypothetical protein